VIKPHEFQEFDVSLGPLPQTNQLVFKALQTYSDSDVVRWIDEPAGGAEPEHPAPTLKLAKAATGSDTRAGPSTAAQDAAATINKGDKDNDGTAISLAIAGLILGLAGLVAGVLAYRRTGRTS
jgi:hypothetical protein